MANSVISLSIAIACISLAAAVLYVAFRDPPQPPNVLLGKKWRTKTSPPVSNPPKPKKAAPKGAAPPPATEDEPSQPSAAPESKPPPAPKPQKIAESTLVKAETIAESAQASPAETAALLQEWLKHDSAMHKHLS